MTMTLTNDRPTNPTDQIRALLIVAPGTVQTLRASNLIPESVLSMIQADLNGVARALDVGDTLQAAAELDGVAGRAGRVCKRLTYLAEDEGDTVSLEDTQTVAGVLQVRCQTMSGLARHYGNRCANCGKKSSTCRFCAHLSDACCGGYNDCHRRCPGSVKGKLIDESRNVLDAMEETPFTADAFESLAVRLRLLARQLEGL